jgi:hypothetical protein
MYLVIYSWSVGLYWCYLDKWLEDSNDDKNENEYITMLEKFDVFVFVFEFWRSRRKVSSYSKVQVDDVV